MQDNLKHSIAYVITAVNVGTDEGRKKHSTTTFITEKLLENKKPLKV